MQSPTPPAIPRTFRQTRGMPQLVTSTAALTTLATAAPLLAWVGDARTRRLRAQLDATRITSRPTVVDPAELEPLPPPVQRYLHQALAPERGVIESVRAQHQGQFNLSETGERWLPFTSDQLVVTSRPGFDWEGRIRLLPGVNIRVHDAYIAGEGILHAALFGWLPVVNARDRAELARGELLRFLAEAAWYPTALLPSQGVRWEGLDDRAARATLVDGNLTASLDFEFDEAGMIASVTTQARGRTVAGKIIQTPWQGRFWNYAARSGIQVPLEGEVAWLLPEGPKPYWRGHLVNIAHEFAPTATTQAATS